ncbi:MAG: metallophosphoesterase [Neomegalonema sp.]|nr:metallophosphoesterase [Neomegalonema sp.]
MREEGNIDGGRSGDGSTAPGGAPRRAGGSFEIPDFALALILFPETFDRAEADALARRLFPADELCLAPEPEARVVAAETRLKQRLPAVVALSAKDKALQDALRAARTKHAPVAALLLAGAAAPPGVSLFHRLEGAPPRLRRAPLQCDRRDERGPFDIIGDVHGCYDELVALLTELGWRVKAFRKGETLIHAEPPAGRRAIFVGDLVDRGPRNVDALRLAMGMVKDGVAHAVIGNHDHKLMRMLDGANVTRNHGLAETEQELLSCSDQFREKVRQFMSERPDHLWFDGGALIVAHAGLKAHMHGRAGKSVRKFAMFGDITGERDAFGLPVRLDWAEHYRAETAVVYGHTPTLRNHWRNETICVDSGCCFGGRLTAVRWPERELASVPALRRYSEPIKPLDGA